MEVCLPTDAQGQTNDVVFLYKLPFYRSTNSDSDLVSHCRHMARIVLN